MEKVKLGLEMATRWTDPTCILILLLPYTIAFLGSTGYFLYKASLAVLPYAQKGLIPQDDELYEVLYACALVFAPYAFTWFWWNCLYHQFFEDKTLDTSKFVTFRKPSMAKYWRHRRIPICELYEWYIEEECDWNPDCEAGDCFLILHKHRHEFVTYKSTWRQCSWLLQQFLPKFMTCGAGLGHGSSSGKSIEETTKEIDEHYNKGNDVFSCIMGPAMVYTCGIFHEVPQFASTGHKGDYKASSQDGSLEQAQFNKMNMLCDKLQLKKGESLLDIGCGWGTLARHAAKEYGAKATGVTLSREGKIYCDMASERTGVETEIMLCDYRNIPEDRQFDKISCIEMAEHVGIANFVNPYLKKVRSLMKNKDSLFMMQVAGLRQGSNWQDVQWGLFMGKYVFPGADASTPLNWYVRQCERAGFEVHSVETIGNHYGHTLHKWYDNWVSHKEEILSGKIDAISEHTKGAHLYRLNEFTWAWCAIHAGQGGGTCYQILCNPCEYDFPRDIWVDGKHVSNSGVTGVGIGGEAQRKAPKYSFPSSDAKKTPAKKTPAKKTTAKKTPAKKSSAKKASTKKTPAKKASAKKASTKKATTPRRSTRSTPKK